MLKKLLFFCLSGLMFSCGDKISEESLYKNNLLWEFAKTRKKYGLIAVGTGGSTNIDNKISSFFIAFNANRFITLEETRVLLVENIEALLEMINSEKKHTDYYETFPFPVSGIEVSIFGCDSLEPGNQYIDIANSVKGILNYYILDPQGSKASVKIHKETFKEAKRIVDEKKAANPPSVIPEVTSRWERLRKKCRLH